MILSWSSAIWSSRPCDWSFRSCFSASNFAIAFSSLIIRSSVLAIAFLLTDTSLARTFASLASSRSISISSLSLEIAISISGSLSLKAANAVSISLKAAWAFKNASSLVWTSSDIALSSTSEISPALEVADFNFMAPLKTRDPPPDSVPLTSTSFPSSVTTRHLFAPKATLLASSKLEATSVLYMEL
ncbi:hypothetical protein OGATHE_006157 [Ogataea polymorpha]|uniref:Uncharacterized protein n=1 Tax=Ogataea polymorpha TaxID=460523 RepID=A0A9P8NR75_9ASCO|nr:hypothetical protein OGATHE_006157 [Ogataea polymorpha]